MLACFIEFNFHNNSVRNNFPFTNGEAEYREVE